MEGKKPGLVGSFIREKREVQKLSQRDLGLLFSPPVTTQFISNIERGVTPLPPSHIPTLVKVLKIQEDEFLNLMEKEYTTKLSGKLGKPECDLLSTEARRFLEQFQKHLGLLNKNEQELLIQKMGAFLKSENESS